MTLELKLVIGEAGSGADQLRQVKDRHVELDVGLLRGLTLPRVQGEMAKRTRGHHRVGPGGLGLGKWLDQLTQGDLLACEHDREAAALDLGRVVDRYRAASLDDALERLGPIGILEAQDLGGPKDLAPVERRNLYAFERAVSDLLQALVAFTLGDLPEQMANLDGAVVRGALQPHAGSC